MTKKKNLLIPLTLASRASLWKNCPQSLIDLLLKLLNSYGVLFEIPEKSLQQIVSVVRYYIWKLFLFTIFRTRPRMKLSEAVASNTHHFAKLIPHMLNEVPQVFFFCPHQNRTARNLFPPAGPGRHKGRLRNLNAISS